MSMMPFLLQAGETTAKGFKEHAANLVFCGVFLIAAISVGAWWLKRG
jgi:hypothetical protein